jgi:hypothetical protein
VNKAGIFKIQAKVAARKAINVTILLPDITRPSFLSITPPTKRKEREKVR